MVFTDEEVKKVGELLNDPNRPLAERFRALFTLKNLGGHAAIDAIASCFTDPSVLLKHELAYCLGQMTDKYAIPTLIKILEDKNQETMVRHEAGEALGAICEPQAIEILQKYSNDPVIEVAETCQLALGRINFYNNKENKINESHNFTSVDPTPPFEITDIKILQEKLCDENLPLFDRYRAMFSLRNLNTPESAKALATGFKGSSALFRHEIGYVLGQMACNDVVNDLAEVVRNKNENEMVRHEAAEALGSIASKEAEAVLKEFEKDDVRVVRESCEVALNMLEYENSNEFQYADGLNKIKE